jgi:hypothetical protein
MLLTPCGGDDWNTLRYHVEALQLSFSPFFLFSPTLSEGYNTKNRQLEGDTMACKVDGDVHRFALRTGYFP